MTISNYLFIIVLITGIGFFVWNFRKIVSTIKIGKPIDKVTHQSKRIKKVLLIALGQSKLFDRPLSAILHVVVYLSFICINIELLEIVIDGVTGSHRVFSTMGSFYNFIIEVFEYLAVGVIIAVSIFWIRRNVLKIKRFHAKEMNDWPKKDANLILYFEFVLMLFFLMMNASDYALQIRGVYQSAGSFPFSQFITPYLIDMDTSSLIMLEQGFWWLHIIGILGFLNYLYYSKHLHIILAFPTVYYGSIDSLGTIKNIPTITQEIKAMMGLETQETTPTEQEILQFGVSDINDLNRLDIMSAYACTECGRCTDVCPANQTGKELSPRKIMMDIRDRATDISLQKNTDKKLLGDHITEEELWACTSCMACADACPITINPMNIILQMRQYLVMEQTKAPETINTMMNNIETNGAPWAYNALDRINWKKS